MRPGILFLSLLLQILGLSPARGQYAHSDHPAWGGQRISALSPMFQGSASFASTLLQAPAPEQVWDSVSKHYRGSYVNALRYPELAAAGLRSFRLSNSRDVSRYSNANAEVNDQLRYQTESFFSGDKQRTRRNFYFDDSGWLRAIVTTSINPEYEAYTEKHDSIHYNLEPDGSGTCVWSSREVSTGSGYAARTGCPPMPAFHRIVREHQQRIGFDAWQNITVMESMDDELWDTCRGGGPRIRTLQVGYDSIGRAVRFEELLNGKPSGFTVANRYEELSLAKLEARTGNSYAYAPLREISIRNWLLRQRNLTVVMLYRTETHTRYYDNRSNREMYRPDSPLIRTDTFFYVINSAKQPVVTRKSGERDPFELYMRWQETNQGRSQLLLQQLPVPPNPAAGPATICDPLALSGGQVYRTERLLLGSDTLIRVTVAEVRQPAESGSYPDRYGELRTKPSRFTTELPPTSFAEPRGMELRDSRGLTRFIWSRSDIHQLSYSSNEAD